MLYLDRILFYYSQKCLISWYLRVHVHVSTHLCGHTSACVCKWRPEVHLGDWSSRAIILFGGFSFVVVLFYFTCIWHERVSMYVHVGGEGGCLHMCVHACGGPRLTSGVFPYLPPPYVVCSKPKATGSYRLQKYSESSSSYPTTPSSYLPQVAIFIS